MPFLRLMIVFLSSIGTEGATVLARGEAQSGPSSAQYQILFKKSDAIWIMNRDGSAPRQLARNGESPVCTPDGKRILFVRLESGPKRFRNIYTMRRDGTHLAPLTQEVRVASNLTLSPDSQHAAFTQMTTQQSMLNKGRLYRIDLDSAVITPLTEEMLEIRSPLWSPDGASIAFAATISETNPDAVVYILDLTSGKTHRAMESKLKHLSFSWAPDGQKLAVGPGIDIVEVASLTKTYVSLPIGIRAERVSWSPDGETLAFESESGCQGIFTGEIYTIRLDGSQLKKVSNTRWFHCRAYKHPQWSPDGATILSTADRYKGDMDFNPLHKSIPSNIYAVDADGSNERNLNNDETTAYEDPVWCPLPSDPGR